MTNKTLKIYSPYDRQLIADYPLNTLDDVDKALGTAYELANNPDKSILIPERKRILKETIRILRDRFDKVVSDSAQEGGKPLTDTKIEVERALNGIEIAIETIPHMIGSEIPMNQNAASLNRLAYTFREPIGVVVAISAFNHPVNLIVHQVVPAVATGCPVIVKPASTTPTSCFNVVNALYDAGLPKEWCRVMITNRDAATKLVTDRRVSFLTFIGSGEVGWKLASQVAPGVKYAMEHGGVAPVIFEPDADINDALPLLIKAGFYHAGQVCVSVQKLFVHESVIDEVADKLA
ncbi:MAG: aldehyde dehydrogenase family protein, partial [bacterium]